MAHVLYYQYHLIIRLCEIFHIAQEFYYLQPVQAAYSGGVGDHSPDAQVEDAVNMLSHSFIEK